MLTRDARGAPGVRCYGDSRRVGAARLEKGQDARGTGVGRALIEAVHKEAAKVGVTNVYWMTHETNDTARRLYDRVARRTGFIEYDMLP